MPNLLPVKKTTVSGNHRFMYRVLGAAVVHGFGRLVQHLPIPASLLSHDFVGMQTK